MQSWLVPFHSKNVGFYPLFVEGADIKAGMHWVSVPWRQAWDQPGCRTRCGGHTWKLDVEKQVK